MKVNDPNGSSIGGVGSTQDLGTTGQSRRGRGGRSDRSDQVQISNLSSALYASEAESPGHTAKLAQLFAIVDSGNYHIDSQALSASIIRDGSRTAA